MKSATDVLKTDLAYIVEELKQEFTEIQGSRLLLTGGAGFLGYYFTNVIVFWNSNSSGSNKIDLVVWDNFKKGLPKWLTDLHAVSALRLQEHDVSKALPKDMEDFDYIVHAASIASPVHYRKNPIETMDANVNGLRNLLEYAKRRKLEGTPIRGLLFFSSSEVYGEPLPGFIPTPESYRGNVSFTGPRACYDESKRYAETLCVNFANIYDLPVKVARPFNNYGPGLKINDGRAIADFARNILNKEDIILFSDGSPTRTFCYVADATVGYYKVLTRGVKGEAYNIGTESPEISILELANKMAEIARGLFGYKGSVKIAVKSEDAYYMTDSPNRRCPSIEKAKRELCYRPSINIDEGLLRTLIWYSENRVMEGLQ